MRLDCKTAYANHYELVHYWANVVVADRFVWADTGTFEICVPRTDPQNPNVIIIGPDGSSTRTFVCPFRIRIKATAPDSVKRALPEFVQP